MQSVLEEIAELRGGAPMNIDRHNSNRFRLMMRENDGSTTAYYFSMPIYNRKNRKLIDMRFWQNGEAVYAVGSNADITVLDHIRMENTEGVCTLELPQPPILLSDRELCCGNIHVTLTGNGVAVKCPIKGKAKADFIVAVGEPFLDIRANDKCFALMKERFRPLAVFSSVGTTDVAGNVIAPAAMEYQKLSDRKFRISVSATSDLAQYVVFEGNLYENKLFQDTTVESGHPTVNNAFGGVGFIGNTSVYGEQWLYSRPDHTVVSDLADKRIKKAVLHMPNLNASKAELRAFRIKARFCSFGSNWDNKIVEDAAISDSTINGRYQSIELTPLLIDPLTNVMMPSEGLILKSKVRDGRFTVIGTADSYLAPQILEINFR